MNTATATDSNRTAEADALDAIRIARRASTMAATPEERASAVLAEKVAKETLHAIRVAEQTAKEMAKAARREKKLAKEAPARSAASANLRAALADPAIMARVAANMERQAQLASKPRVDAPLTAEQLASEAEDDWTFNVPRAVAREYGGR